MPYSFFPYSLDLPAVEKGSLEAFSNGLLYLLGHLLLCADEASEAASIFIDKYLSIRKHPHLQKKVIEVII